MKTASKPVTRNLCSPLFAQSKSKLIRQARDKNRSVQPSQRQSNLIKPNPTTSLRLMRAYPSISDQIRVTFPASSRPILLQRAVKKSEIANPQKPPEI